MYIKNLLNDFMKGEGHEKEYEGKIYQIVSSLRGRDHDADAGRLQQQDKNR